MFYLSFENSRNQLNLWRTLNRSWKQLAYTSQVVSHLYSYNSGFDYFQCRLSCCLLCPLTPLPSCILPLIVQPPKPWVHDSAALVKLQLKIHHFLLLLDYPGPELCRVFSSHQSASFKHLRKIIINFLLWSLLPVPHYTVILLHFLHRNQLELTYSLVDYTTCLIPP